MTSHPSEGSTRILLVEDNPGDVRLVREAFETTTADTAFQIVGDGSEALAVLRDRREAAGDPYPHLLLLDLNLPRTDGFDVLDAIGDDPEYPSIPALVLTSSDADEDVVRSYELGANAFLTKPDGPDEFAALARTVEAFWIETARTPSVPS